MKVDCNACGETLEVADHTHYVTCVECTARLEVKRTPSAIFTEVLGADDVAVVKKHLEKLASTAPPKPTVASAAGGESVLRLFIGLLLLGSDLYWWVTSPSMQSLYARGIMLAAGAWLVISGLLRIISNARARLKAYGAAHAAIESRRSQIEQRLQK